MKIDFQKKWEEYVFDPTTLLFTNDIYAYFGKGGTQEFISQKMTELAGREIVVPKFIKNDKLWNEIVKPFRELPQEVHKILKNELSDYLLKISEEKKNQKEQNPKENAEKMNDYFRNQYELNLDKELNKFDIIAFYFQYGKGAQNKLIELASNYLEKPITIEVRKGDEFEEKIVNPIRQRGVFSGREFKKILIDNITQQQAYKEEQNLKNDDNIVVFDRVKKELFTIDVKNENINLKLIPIFGGENKHFIMSYDEWNSLKTKNIDNWVIGKRENYEEGMEFALGFTGQKELFKITKIEPNSENPLLNKIHFEAQKGINIKGEEPQKEILYQFDINLFIGQNKALLVTPTMKEKGFSLNKNFEDFHLEHLKKMDISKGITDKNLFAIINLKMSDNLGAKRQAILEEYTGKPFEELKKTRKNDMINIVYHIKGTSGEDKNEFKLKSEIQNLYLATEAERNIISPEAYEKYLEGLSFVEKEHLELSHIDKIIIQSQNILELFKDTPLENNEKINNILNMFEAEDKENILYSKSFHLGEKELEAKQYLLNTINNSENREQLIEIIKNNLEEEMNLKKGIRR